MKIVKMAKVGQKIKEVALGDAANIAAALQAAGICVLSSEIIFRNHKEVRMGSEVYNGDTVIVERKSLSNALMAFIDYLLENKIIEEEDYYLDDEDTLDYADIYNDNRTMIDGLVESARKV